ncbi:GNAT family N-acetyltransferase [Clostridium sp. D2Q-11]|uniref:GNAT family N-acetyltransferase n=1 Tax=Anaeromonas frigoriresistens TaxID=2683708 RepID=A0A942Z9N4_9FIRM|nr:GNAT family protein [Anaeromonas frigoriresistens]MBS4539334.1 GNAT family N-acetyltransferase [Anaeromonas frigoriresistens]
MKEICYDNYYWQNDLVRLRAMQPEDWDNHFTDLYDSIARRRLQYEIELPPTIVAEKENTEKFSNFDPASGRLMFVIETLDGISVGSFNMNSIDEKNGTFSIGMQIGSEYRSKGYGTAAMRILLRYAFFERRLNKYYGSVIEDNIASATMLKKLGCVQEGIRRQQIYTDGRYCDEILFGLTKEDFTKNKKDK